MHDLIGGFTGDAPARHALAQLHLHLGHSPLAALEAERTPQLLRLAAREAGGDHRHAQELLLEQRHAERARENGLERRVGIAHLLAAAPSPDVGMHHVADDRAGADDRDLHDQVVEPLRVNAWQRRHLCATLDLEHADRVGALEHAVHGGVVGGQVREIDGAARLAHERDRFLQHRHHSQSEEIDLHDAERRAVVLVPLHHHAAGHRGRLERHDVVQAAGGNDHPARVLAEMARQILDACPERGELSNPRMPRVAAGLREVSCEDRLRILVAPVLHETRESVLHVGRKPEGLADLTRGAAAPVRDDVGGHPRPEPPVAPIHVLDHALAAIAARQIEVDVRPLAARLGEKPLKQQIHLHRIHRGDAERIADRAVGGRATALHEHLVAATELDDVPHDEEIAGEVEPADDLQLVRHLAARALGHRAGVAVPVADAARDEVSQMGVRAGPRRERKVRKPIAEILEREPQTQRQLAAGRDGFRHIAKGGRHHRGVAQPTLGVDQ